LCNHLFAGRPDPVILRELLRNRQRGVEIRPPLGMIVKQTK
jgi:hypothetical protein